MKDILAKLAALEGKKSLNESVGVEDRFNDLGEANYGPGRGPGSASRVPDYDGAGYDDDENTESELYSGCYVRDIRNDGPRGEVFRMSGDPDDRRVRISDRQGRGWNIHPSSLTLVPDGHPDISRYFGDEDDEDDDEGYGGGDIEEANDFTDLGTEVDEGLNHMNEREYQSWHGWKAACRKAFPGCAFRGDRDIGAATLDGHDVGEWDGAVGCVYNNNAMPKLDTVGEFEESTEAPTNDEFDGDGYLKYKQSCWDKGKRPLSRSQYEFDMGQTNPWDQSDYINQTNESKADPLGAWIAYKSPTEFKRFKTREGAKKKVASSEGWKIASSEYFYGKIKKQQSAESVTEDGIAQATLAEKSTSEKQARFMAASAHDPKFAKKVGMNQSVAKEFNKADTGTKQLSNAMKHKKTTEGIGKKIKRAVDWGLDGDTRSPKELASQIKGHDDDTLKAWAKPAGMLGTGRRKLQDKLVSREMSKRGMSNESTEGKRMSTSFIIEGVKFRVSDPKVAKILRRFPHEATTFDAGGELADELFDALYDHYLLVGEMPYGVAKARNGDPYEWVSEKLSQELKSSSDTESLGEGLGEGNPEILEILEKYPHEAKEFRESGVLEDGPLYDELYDHYCNNGEMPYGIAKARDGDPVEWVYDQLIKDAGSNGITDEGMGGDIMPLEAVDNPGDEWNEDPYDLDDPAPMVDEAPMDPSALAARKAKLAADAAKDRAFKKAGDQWNKGYKNPFAGDSKLQHNDELAWRSQGGKVAFHEEDEETFDPTENLGSEDVLTEVSMEDQSRIIDMLSNIGLDEGLDFFFDGDELVVIGRSTARVVVNTVGGHIKSIDGEEVRISASPREKPVADRNDVDNLVAQPDLEMEGMNEAVQLNIVADGEDDVLAIIKKLSGLTTADAVNDEFAGNEEGECGVEVSSEPSGMGSMIAAMDQIENNPEEFCEPGQEGEGCEQDNEVEEAEYANAPDPEVHTSTTQMINQGDDLNRPKKQGYPLRPLGNNPMAEARVLLKQYESLKGMYKK